jgi:hypothetical protein
VKILRRYGIPGLSPTKLEEDNKLGPTGQVVKRYVQLRVDDLANFVLSKSHFL